MPTTIQYTVRYFRHRTVNVIEQGIVNHAEKQSRKQQPFGFPQDKIIERQNVISFILYLMPENITGNEDKRFQHESV